MAVQIATSSNKLQECSDHTLRKVHYNFFMFFFHISIVFVRGVLKGSDENLEARHIRQSYYNRQIRQGLK